VLLKSPFAKAHLFFTTIASTVIVAGKMVNYFIDSKSV